MTRPWGTGCSFEPRCTRSDDACVGAAPPLETVRGHGVRCVHPLGADAETEETR